MRVFRSGSRFSSFFSDFRSFFNGYNGDMWKMIMIVSVIVLLALITIGSVIFFFSLEGSEQILVPEVVGKELTDGLIELQDNALSPFVQKRFSSDPALKGKIVNQEPHGGTLVKAGRQIKLTVSMGAVIDRVGLYTGRDLNEVRAELQELFVSSRPLLRIKEPVMYVFSNQNAGIILEQKPKPDTKISDLTDIELVVSRGPEAGQVIVERYQGREYRETMKILAQANIPFVFTTRPAASGESAGMIVKQNPVAGSPLSAGSVLQLEMTEPAVPKGFVRGTFDYVLPDYFIMVDLTLEKIKPAGERELMFTTKHPGGTLSVPYVEQPNTILVLTVQGREIQRHLVSTPLSLVQ